MFHAVNWDGTVNKKNQENMLQLHKNRSLQFFVYGYYKIEISNFFYVFLKQKFWDCQ